MSQTLFHQACTFIDSGDLSSLEQLGDLSSILNLYDDQQETLLTRACAKTSNDLGIVKYLLSHKSIDINKGYTSSSGTPLYIASKSGHLNLVELLLSQSSQIDVNKGFGANYAITPLCVACECNHEEIVKKLLEHSASASFVYSSSPLYYACKNGNLEIVKLLLSHDANVNLGGNEFSSDSLSEPKKVSPLHVALEGQHLEIVKELAKCSDLKYETEVEFAKSLGIDMSQFVTDSRSCLVM